MSARPHRPRLLLGLRRWMRRRSNTTAHPIRRRDDMANIETGLKEMMEIEGAIGAAVVDYSSGMALGTLSSTKTLDLEVAAAGNTEVVRAKMRTMDQLGLNDAIEDILITLSGQYHVIKPLTSRKGQGLFLYLALDRNRGNLALARHRLKSIEAGLEV
ncbi:hypothetical protein GCM10007147_33060 [Nocardiopsis kunsanensis]|uniref:Roadblock/LC7 domain-containing protein n=2 Tax=Nocardiopsis kunsanensis TaxID=141693 RepID=A0A918XGM9_9ACTN|nr:hypothetical protein GCM10007147_33060 [Nocardiopsis kunsanensis]